MFCWANKLVFPIYVSDQTFKNSMDLLLSIDGNKSHYVYIKDLTVIFYKEKNKYKKNTFARVVCSGLVVKMC